MTQTLLFRDVSYFINAEGMSQSERDEIERTLKGGGATSVQSSGSSSSSVSLERFDLEHTTHVISLTHSFPEYDSCIDAQVDSAKSRSSGKPFAVSPDWVRRSAQLGMLQSERLYSCNRAMIFSGVVVCCSRIPKMDVELICGGVSSLGGGWKVKLTRDVTHLVTLVPAGSKFEQVILNPEHKIKIVSPHWVDDCFRFSKLLPTTQYEFNLEARDYPACMRSDSVKDKDPMVVEEQEKQQKRLTELAALRDSEQDKILLEKSRQSSPKLLEGKSFYFAREILRADARRIDALVERIRLAGGVVIATEDSEGLKGIKQGVRNADIVISKYRSSQEYREAIRLGKTVGSIIWLFNVFASGQVTDPRAELLHYPLPYHPIPNFDKQRITITNYTGTARIYLRELIQRMGGTFTPEMTRENTMCVAAALEGEKVQRAREWGIPVVNHLWLDCCFLEWEMLDHADMRFIDFPSHIDFQSLVGSTGLDESSLEPWITDALENDEAPVGNDATSASAKPKSSSRADQPVENGDSANGSKNEATEAQKTPGSRIRTRVAAEGVGETPNTSTKRAKPSSSVYSSASKKARICGMDEDEGEKEEKDDGGKEVEGTTVVRGKKQDISVSVKSPRTPSSAKRNRVASTSPSSTPVTKMANTSPSSASVPACEPAASRGKTIKYATTGVELTDAEVKALARLGAERTESVQEADYLVAAKLGRTEKMLGAIASGTTMIVDSRWVKENATKPKARDRLVPGTDFPLSDQANEKKWNFTLSESLQRSARNPSGLLRGMAFYFTKGCKPDVNVLRRVVESAGGKAPRKEPTSNEISRGETKSGEKVFIISCPEDKKVWKNFDRLKIYDTELVLASVLKQVLESDRHLLRE
ncbi:hypothetical protein IE53DRAFT_346139 [Violaceomyces palustris]|uniref:Uncharacterized protein n=1 Tax=Violaceomyces palustris TaxID=1673888 RepID=A0ACD0NTX1_9BASI|nr:hypothetical protein IE53DRAFT_346139 [Violaceomyces palustris]